MLTQTIINLPCLFIASGRLTDLITSYCSIYPGVPCTIQLPNIRFLFFLARLAVAACHVLQVLPGQLRLLLRVPALHPASCSRPGQRHWLSQLPVCCTCWRSQHGAPVQEFLAALVQNNQEGPKECHEFRVRFQGTVLLPPLLYQALKAH